MKSVIIIPARYASTRFPGKVLADICGKPMIQLVHEKAAASKASAVVVATDDEKVFSAVRSFGGKAVMTSPKHPSGTDRVHEAVEKICPDADIVINVQGDEPMIPTDVINGIIEKMGLCPEIEMATVAVPASRPEISSNPNIVKVVCDVKGFALYFSRSPIPFLREGGEDLPLNRHWGIYGYRRKTLKRLVSLPESRLEKCEKLEQLRAMENGIRIFVLVSDFTTVGVDTPEDLHKVIEIFRTNRQGEAI